MSDPTGFVRERSRGETAAGVLRTTTAVRERCGQLLDRARVGQSQWFTVDDGRLRDAADAIGRSIRRRHGSHAIPYSRWRHLEAGGIDRRAQLERLLGDVAPQVRAHALVDLAVVAVLLDMAVDGPWKYVEPASGTTLHGPEATAVAAFHAFTAGLFSSDKLRPLQVDAQALRALPTDRLAQALQVSEGNALPGLKTRAVLLRRLGEVMAEQPEVFTNDARPSGLFDLMVADEGGIAHSADVDAHDVLSQLLVSLSPIWPVGHSIGGVPLGDCWRHSAVRGEGASDGWVPFHALSQWLAYSLLEPFEWSGVQVRGIDRLTALPGPHEGGLLLDTGVLRLREPDAARQAWYPGDEIVVEWRAMTVALLEELAGTVRGDLGAAGHGLPLSVVVGGAADAGLECARRERDGRAALRVQAEAPLA